MPNHRALVYSVLPYKTEHTSWSRDCYSKDLAEEDKSFGQ